MDATGPGAVLLGKYRVDEVIGSGGMGRVVKASHLYLQQPVAIKILLRELAENPATVARFLREAQATVQLKSEHIARVIDVGTLGDGTPVMVMEYLTGNDLNQILRHHGPQPPAVVCDLMLQACEGLAEAHAGSIVHRDVKPSNFFITQRPDGSMLLKILDFGISKTPVGLSDLTGTQTVLGTPTYMAPEQMKSGRAADARSDVWSLGVVMYQLMAGRLPFEAESYAALVLQVNGEPPSPIPVPLPAGLGEVIMRCLEKDPAARFQSVAELARMIAPYASDPLAASLSAGRTTRILQHRGGAAALAGPAAGLATPVPLSPAQLTPRSWAPSSTSLSQGAGQMTMNVRAPRAWVIAGISVLALAVIGLVASAMTKDEAPRRRDEPYVEAPLARPAASGEAAGAAGGEATGAATAAPGGEATAAGSAHPVEPAAVAAEPPAVAPPPPPPAPAPTITVPPPVAAAIAAPPPPSPTFPVGPGSAAAPEPAAATPEPVAAAPAPAAEPKPAPRPAVKPVVKPRPAPRPARPAPKPRPQPKSDDLFDTRH